MYGRRNKHGKWSWEDTPVKPMKANGANMKQTYLNPVVSIISPVGNGKVRPTNQQTTNTRNNNDNNNNHTKVQVSTPPAVSKAISSEHWGAPSSPLRTNFIVALFPLIVFGFPIHLLLQQRRVPTFKVWFRLMPSCSSPLVFVLTIVTLIVTGAFNALTGYVVGKFFYKVLVLGELDFWVLLELLYAIFKTVPVVIPLDLTWLFGYELNNLIGSFDRVVCFWRPIDSVPFPKISSRRTKLFMLYVLVIAIHGLLFVCDYFDGDLPNFKGMSPFDIIWTVVIDYAINFLPTFALPVYCTFVWAIHYELEMMKGYITALIHLRVSPRYSHLDELKRISRKIVDDVVKVNSIFSILLSVAIVMAGFHVFYEQLPRIGQFVIITLVPVLSSVLKSSSGSGTTTSPQLLSPEDIRIIFGEGVAILLYLALILLTYWQAVKLNDEIRFLHVSLNDLVTEPEARLPKDVHDGYTLLKWYLHSRLTQEKPGLLTIAAVGFVPGMSRRLLQYRVRY